MNTIPINLFGVSAQPTDAQVREAYKAPIPADAVPLKVTITREPFMDWLVLEHNGQTDELTHVEALEWFRVHGVKTEVALKKVNDQLNRAVNFGSAIVVIRNPVQPVVRKLDVAEPDL